MRNSNVNYNLIRSEWVLFVAYGACVQTSGGSLDDSSSMTLHSMTLAVKLRICSDRTPTLDRADDN